MDNSVESTPDRAQRQKELDELRKKELAKNRREKFEYGKGQKHIMGYEIYFQANDI
jgi:hypothetical protein